MLSDKKFGLSVNLMATRVMPSLLPQTVNPSLNLEQFTGLLEVLQEMLDHIDRYVQDQIQFKLEPVFNNIFIIFFLIPDFGTFIGIIWDIRVSIVFFLSVGMLEYILGCREMIFSQEMFKAFAHNLKKKYFITLSAFDEKFLEIL
jgi:hypothetical protein